MSSQTWDALTDLSAHSLVLTVGSFVVVLTGIVSTGLLLTRILLRRAPGEELAAASVTLGLGFCGYGAIVFAIGFVPVLERVPLVVVSVVTALLALPLWSDAARTARSILAQLGDAIRREWLVVIPSLGVLVLVFAAGFQPPRAPDEVQYHWAAPMIWAHAGHWVTTPLRFTNGFHLAEVLYTPAAVFDSPTSAHWLHAVTLIVLALATGALARRLGASGALAAAAIIAVPAAAGQSWWAYNDLFAAALMVCACVAASDNATPRNWWTAGVLVAGAFSIKPLLVFVAPAVLVIAWLRQRENGKRPPFREYAHSFLAIVVPGAVASAGWFLYTRVFTGEWFQRTGIVVAHQGDDPSHGLATLRIPSLVEVLEVPFLPIVTGIIGQRQPYGSRTGLVVTAFVPLMIIAAFLMDRGWRRQLAALAVPALTAYLVASTVIVRTRFLVVVYALVVAAAALTVKWWRRDPANWVGAAVLWAFRICVVVGLVDTARKALM